MTKSLAELHTWTIEPLLPDVAKAIERLRRAEDVCRVAVMPDVHLATDVCVGVVVATHNMLYPPAVGNDIGCGMAAVAIDASADLLDDEHSAALVLRQLYERVPSNRHRGRCDLPDSLQKLSLSDPALEKLAQRDGLVQLGTLGRGNHFLEFQADEEERLWVMVHSGSRGVGQAISRHHTTKCTGKSAGLPFLEADSDAGRAYQNDLEWARCYARESRLSMLRSVAAILVELFGAPMDWESMIQSDHNHVRRESHFGEEYWVHRKGAQPADAGEAGLIPGSMGTASVHVTGRGCPEALLSCSHGCGRELSRDAARRRISPGQLEDQLHGVWYDRRRSRQLCDEAPAAYKDIDDVVRAQRDLVRLVRRLRPILSYKGF